MEQVTLNATLREGRGKSVTRKLRAQDLIPAVVYGPSVDTVSVTLAPKELLKILTGPYKKNAIFDLVVEGGPTHQVRLKAFDRHPVSRRLQHADFIVVRDDTPIYVDVPIRLVGTARGIKLGGALKQLHREVTLRCLPKDVPAELVFDVTKLGVGQRALAGSIEAPPGTELIIENDFAIAQVIIPRGLAAEEEEEEEGEGEGEGEEAAEPAPEA